MYLKLRGYGDSGPKVNVKSREIGRNNFHSILGARRTRFVFEREKVAERGRKKRAGGNSSDCFTDSSVTPGSTESSNRKSLFSRRPRAEELPRGRARRENGQLIPRAIYIYIYCILYLYTQTNVVCDFITLNYNSMTHCVEIY